MGMHFFLHLISQLIVHMETDHPWSAAASPMSSWHAAHGENRGLPMGNQELPVGKALHGRARYNDYVLLVMSSPLLMSAKSAALSSSSSGFSEPRLVSKSAGGGGGGGGAPAGGATDADAAPPDAADAALP